MGQEFIVNGKWILDSNPYRGEADTIKGIMKELSRHKKCHHAYCLNCKTVQACEPDEVFLCKACGWRVGEAIP